MKMSLVRSPECDLDIRDSVPEALGAVDELDPRIYSILLLGLGVDRRAAFASAGGRPTHEVYGFAGQHDARERGPQAVAV